MADKTLLEKVEEANRQPVPDRRLTSSVAVEQINAQEPIMELSDRIEGAKVVQLEYGPDENGYHETWSLTDDERQMIINALRQIEQKLSLVK